MRFWVLLVQLLDKMHPALAVRLSLHFFATPKRILRPAHEDELIRHGQRVVLKCGLVAYKFGEGLPVLLVHGWEGRGTQLGFFAEPLVKKGYAVYALDGPAHGESPGRQTTPVHYATFIKTVGRELGPLKSLIAHSFGAGASVMAAAEGLQVESLILIAGPNQYGRVVDHYCDQIKLRTNTRELFKRELTNRVGIPADDLTVSVWGQKTQARLLLVHDRHDKAVRFESSERIHAAVSGSRLLVTEGLGHRRVLKDAHVISQVVKFID